MDNEIINQYISKGFTRVQASKLYYEQLQLRNSTEKVNRVLDLKEIKLVSKALNNLNDIMDIINLNPDPNFPHLLKFLTKNQAILLKNAGLSGHVDLVEKAGLVVDDEDLDNQIEDEEDYDAREDCILNFCDLYDPNRPRNSIKFSKVNHMKDNFESFQNQQNVITSNPSVGKISIPNYQFSTFSKEEIKPGKIAISQRPLPGEPQGLSRNNSMLSFNEKTPDVEEKLNIKKNSSNNNSISNIISSFNSINSAPIVPSRTPPGSFLRKETSSSNLTRNNSFHSKSLANTSDSPFSNTISNLTGDLDQILDIPIIKGMDIDISDDEAPLKKEITKFSEQNQEKKNSAKDSSQSSPVTSSITSVSSSVLTSDRILNSSNLYINDSNLGEERISNFLIPLEENDSQHEDLSPEKSSKTSLNSPLIASFESIHITNTIIEVPEGINSSSSTNSESSQLPPSTEESSTFSSKTPKKSPQFSERIQNFQVESTDITSSVSKSEQNSSIFSTTSYSSTELTSLNISSTSTTSTTKSSIDSSSSLSNDSSQFSIGSISIGSISSSSSLLSSNYSNISSSSSTTSSSTSTSTSSASSSNISQGFDDISPVSFSSSSVSNSEIQLSSSTSTSISTSSSVHSIQTTGFNSSNLSSDSHIPLNSSFENPLPFITSPKLSRTSVKSSIIESSTSNESFISNLSAKSTSINEISLDFHSTSNNSQNSQSTLSSSTTSSNLNFTKSTSTSSVSPISTIPPHTPFVTSPNYPNSNSSTEEKINKTSPIKSNELSTSIDSEIGFSPLNSDGEKFTKVDFVKPLSSKRLTKKTFSFLSLDSISDSSSIVMEIKHLTGPIKNHWMIIDEYMKEFEKYAFGKHFVTYKCSVPTTPVVNWTEIDITKQELTSGEKKCELDAIPPAINYAQLIDKYMKNFIQFQQSGEVIVVGYSNFYLTNLKKDLHLTLNNIIMKYPFFSTISFIIEATPFDIYPKSNYFQLLEIYMNNFNQFSQGDFKASLNKCIPSLISIPSTLKKIDITNNYDSGSFETTLNFNITPKLNNSQIIQKYMNQMNNFTEDMYILTHSFNPPQITFVSLESLTESFLTSTIQFNCEEYYNIDIPKTEEVKKEEDFGEWGVTMSFSNEENESEINEECENNEENEVEIEHEDEVENEVEIENVKDDEFGEWGVTMDFCNEENESEINEEYEQDIEENEDKSIKELENEKENEIEIENVKDDEFGEWGVTMSFSNEENESEINEECENNEENEVEIEHEDEVENEVEIENVKDDEFGEWGVTMDFCNEESDGEEEFDSPSQNVSHESSSNICDSLTNFSTNSFAFHTNSTFYSQNEAIIPASSSISSLNNSNSLGNQEFLTQNSQNSTSNSSSSLSNTNSSDIDHNLNNFSPVSPGQISSYTSSIQNSFTSQSSTIDYLVAPQLPQTLHNSHTSTLYKLSSNYETSNSNVSSRSIHSHANQSHQNSSISYKSSFSITSQNASQNNASVSPSLTPKSNSPKEEKSFTFLPAKMDVSTNLSNPTISSEFSTDSIDNTSSKYLPNSSESGSISTSSIENEEKKNSSNTGSVNLKPLYFSPRKPINSSMNKQSIPMPTSRSSSQLFQSSPANSIVSSSTSSSSTSSSSSYFTQSSEQTNNQYDLSRDSDVFLNKFDRNALINSIMNSMNKSSENFIPDQDQESVTQIHSDSNFPEQYLQIPQDFSNYDQQFVQQNQPYYQYDEQFAQNLSQQYPNQYMQNNLQQHNRQIPIYDSQNGIKFDKYCTYNILDSYNHHQQHTYISSNSYTDFMNMEENEKELNFLLSQGLSSETASEYVSKLYKEKQTIHNIRRVPLRLGKYTHPMYKDIELYFMKGYSIEQAELLCAEIYNSQKKKEEQEQEELARLIQLQEEEQEKERLLKLKFEEEQLKKLIEEEENEYKKAIEKRKLEEEMSLLLAASLSELDNEKYQREKHQPDKNDFDKKLQQLLKNQEEIYGTNMFKSLTSKDEAEIDLLISQGLNYNDAILIIFDRKFKNKSNNSSNLSSKNKFETEYYDEYDYSYNHKVDRNKKVENITYIIDGYYPYDDYQNTSNVKTDSSSTNIMKLLEQQQMEQAELQKKLKMQEEEIQRLTEIQSQSISQANGQTNQMPLLANLPPEQRQMVLDRMVQEQLDNFGFTMYDLIKEEDLPYLADCESLGFWRIDAIIVLFNTKYLPNILNGSININTLSMNNMSMNNMNMNNMNMNNMNMNNMNMNNMSMNNMSMNNMSMNNMSMNNIDSYNNHNNTIYGNNSDANVSNLTSHSPYNATSHLQNMQAQVFPNSTVNHAQPLNHQLHFTHQATEPINQIIQNPDTFPPFQQHLQHQPHQQFQS